MSHASGSLQAGADWANVSAPVRCWPGSRSGGLAVSIMMFLRLACCCVSFFPCGWERRWNRRLFPQNPASEKWLCILQEIIRSEDVMKNSFPQPGACGIVPGTSRVKTTTSSSGKPCHDWRRSSWQAGDPRGALTTYGKFDELTARLGQTQAAKVRQMIEHEGRCATCALRTAKLPVQPHGGVVPDRFVSSGYINSREGPRDYPDSDGHAPAMPVAT